jgi:mono/diheme cytochrome c family protein
MPFTTSLSGLASLSDPRLTPWAICRRRYAAICLFLLLSGCTQKMADQPRYDTYEPGSARPIPAGTVPRDAPDPQPALTAVTMDVLTRGRQRYDIYCSPCHGYAGFGDGFVARRGFRRLPQSFHTDAMRAAPPAHFFDVMTNGFGAMPSYAFQVDVPDRWAIAAYIRALQLSQSATLQDLAPDEVQNLR